MAEKELYRRHGLSGASYYFYLWRSKFGRMSVAGGQAAQGAGNGECANEVARQGGSAHLGSLVCPGTGTPVPGGSSTFQAGEVLRRLMGLNMVGADLVEVAPMYDPRGVTTRSTAAVAGDLMYLLAGPSSANKHTIAK